MNDRGFTIIELMITIVIIGMVVGLISANLSGLKRLATRFNDQAVFQEQYLLFLLKFEEDYQQAEIVNGSSNLDHLIFRTDFNLDGDYLDAGENIAYRWQKTRQRIDRKSGDGSFQAFLDGINRFSWQQISNKPICHRVMIGDLFSTSDKSIDFCRPKIENQ